jgi:branched-chain amino acid transport system ATP-binding protein
VLSIEKISVGYGIRPVVRDLSTTVRRGEVVAILGINGAGKTTLLHGLIGFNPLFAGTVRLDGTAIGGGRSHEISRHGLTLVPQGRRIFKSLTVRENLALAQRRARPGRWNMEAVLDLFPRLRERMQHYGNQLSGGEQQMLAWARALVTNPSFILMDEPTEGLAPRFVRLLGELIPRLKAEGIGILLAEQNIEFASSVADRLLIMVNGCVMRSFSGEEIDRDGLRGAGGVRKLASLVQGIG